MPRLFGASILAISLGSLLLGAASGCRFSGATQYPTPAASGLNTRDLIDPIAQNEAERLAPADQLFAAAERLRKERQHLFAEQTRKAGEGDRPVRTILCLSGGGAYGAYPAGVLIGWSERGDRPTFDVVTGISTGALIAVPAFLGSQYDSYMKQFYTTVHNRDLFRVRPFHGLFGDSLADTAPMAARIAAFISPEVMHDLAEAHHAGRRLYIGTTEQEGKQFVVWDIGAIASRNQPADRELIIQILLGSTAAPGLFPPAKINVTVDGACHTERHIDGGVSQSLFFRPPYTPPSQHSDETVHNLGGTKVYVIVAGKLFPEPEVIRPLVLAQVRKSVSTLISAQSRGELQRLYTVCVLGGMDYYVSAIPPEYQHTTSLMEFKPTAMTAMFDEGRRVMSSASPWRTAPPGFEPGESTLARSGTALTYQPRGPLLPINGPKGLKIAPQLPPSDQGPVLAAPVDTSTVGR